MVTSAPPDNLKQVVETCTIDLREQNREEVADAVQSLRDRLRELDASHRAAIGSLLPVERSALPQIVAEYDQRHETVTRELAQARSRLELVGLDSEYRRIDLSFLAQSSAQLLHRGIYQYFNAEVPKFLTYSLDDPRFVLRVAAERRWWTRSLLTGLLVAQPLDALRLGVHQPTIDGLAAWLGSDSRTKSLQATLECTFSGVFPSDVRQQIARARRQFDRVFIVAEAPEGLQWNVETVVAPPPRPRFDPLVIGEKRTGYGTFHWLVAAFDLTPAERYAASEFAYKGEGGN